MTKEQWQAVALILAGIAFWVLVFHNQPCANLSGADYEMCSEAHAQ
jgi:hypothetical protein